MKSQICLLTNTMVIHILYHVHATQQKTAKRILQLPLCDAEANTVHGSQGATFHHGIIMDPGNDIRATALNELNFKQFCSHSFTAQLDKVRNFYQRTSYQKMLLFSFVCIYILSVYYLCTYNLSVSIINQRWPTSLVIYTNYKTFLLYKTPFL